MSLPETFCPLPWIHQATYTDGKLLPCCVARPFTNKNLSKTTFLSEFQTGVWKELRKQMLNGEKPEHCKRCWIEEESGYRSHRMTEREVWKQRLGEGELEKLAQQTKSDGTLEVVPKSIDLRIGNSCNLTCVMCRPHESVKWLGLAQQIFNKTENVELKFDMLYKKTIDISDYNWQDQEQTWHELKEMSPYLSEIIIGGGEPMLLRGQFEFIEYCVRTGVAKNIHLRYHTNLTILNPEYFSLWKEFKCVEFFASIDGLREKNFYVRHPADWTSIEKNLQILDSVEFENIKTMILFSSHFLNFYYLDELSEWIELQNFKRVTKRYNGYLHPGIVMEPSYLSVQAYPIEVKKNVEHRIEIFEKKSLRQSNKIKGVLQFMFAEDKSDLLKTTVEYIRQLDRIRGTSFSKTFPELAEHIHYEP